MNSCAHDRKEELAEVIDFNGRKISKGIVDIFKDEDFDLDNVASFYLAEKIDVGDESLSEFRDVKEWVMALMITGIMKVLPSLSAKDSVNFARVISRRLSQPGTSADWSRIVNRIERYGFKTMVHRIRRELLWDL